MNLEDSRKPLETEVSLAIYQGHLYSHLHACSIPLSWQTEFFGVLINLYMTLALSHIITSLLYVPLPADSLLARILKWENLISRAYLYELSHSSYR